GAAASAFAASARPNFLFVISDQMRAGALAASGNKFCETPNLDALARSGVRFSNAYCAQALCTPSRSALMTGVYPHTSGLDHNLYKVASAFTMPEFRLTPNWPTLLRQAGYHTGYIGKWHLGEDNPGLFDDWAGYNSLKSHWMGEKNKSEYRSDFETRQAIEFLEKHRLKPFVLALSYYPPHTPYDPPQKFEDMYKAKRVDHPGYWGAVTAVDRDLGLVLAKLKALGLDRNTFVSFTADHGETFGQRMGSADKTVSYDDSAKVPLLLRWPAGMPGGLVYEGGVTTLNLMPTMLEAAGLPVPARLQGHSLLGEIRHRDLGWKEPVFLENITQRNVDGKPSIERAVRTREWKLILRDHPRDELYNVIEDPGERNDLMHRPAQKARVRELAGLILKHGETTNDSVAVRLAQRYK
ncbi:MAG: sulfatase family protein, partial [Bryobacteraceae bacterium]